MLEKNFILFRNHKFDNSSFIGLLLTLTAVDGLTEEDEDAMVRGANDAGEVGHQNLTVGDVQLTTGSMLDEPRVDKRWG